MHDAGRDDNQPAAQGRFEDALGCGSGQWRADQLTCGPLEGVDHAVAEAPRPELDRQQVVYRLRQPAHPADGIANPDRRRRAPDLRSCSAMLRPAGDGRGQAPDPNGLNTVV